MISEKPEEETSVNINCSIRSITQGLTHGYGVGHQVVAAKGPYVQQHAHEVDHEERQREVSCDHVRLGPPALPELRPGCGHRRCFQPLAELLQLLPEIGRYLEAAVVDLCALAHHLLHIVDGVMIYGVPQQPARRIGCPVQQHNQHYRGKRYAHIDEGPAVEERRQRGQQDDANGPERVVQYDGANAVHAGRNVRNCRWMRED